MKTSPVEFVGAEGNRLRGLELGEQNLRPSVLFMHGGGQTLHSWAKAAKAVASERCAILLDARGHGSSDWAPSGDYRFATLADDLRAVCTSLKARDEMAPVVVGASMGGLAAMLASARYGNLFSGLVLVDITPRMEQSGVDRILAFMGRHAAEGFATLEDAAAAIAAYRPERAPPQNLRGLAKNLRERDDGRYYWHWDPRFVEGPNPIERHAGENAETLERGLNGITCPILLVRGSQSELVSEEAVAQFRASAPTAEYVDVSGAGHMVVGDRNDAFAEAVLRFLRRW